MNEFKLSKKKIHKDHRSSIEDVHNEKMIEIVKNIDNIDSLKKKLLKLEQYYDVLCKNNSLSDEKYRVHNNISELKKKIFDIESGNEMMDYISKAWEFLLDDQSEEILEDQNIEQDGIYQYIDKVSSSSKGKNYNKYINKCFKNINCEVTKQSNNCENCNENNFSQDSGYLICNNCGNWD